MTGVDEPNQIVNTKHMRYERVLIDNKCAREHMKYLTRKVLKKTKEDEILTREEGDVENVNLMQVVQNKFEPRFTAFLVAFIEDFHTCDNKFIICAIGELLYVLSGDSALSTVLPFYSHDIVTNAIEELRKEGYIQHKSILYFFVQFFLYLLNKDKTEKFQKQASVAVAYFEIYLLNVYKIMYIAHFN